MTVRRIAFWRQDTRREFLPGVFMFWTLFGGLLRLAVRRLSANMIDRTPSMCYADA